MQNPYLGYAPENFFKTGAASKRRGELFTGIWKPKFQITRSTRIATFGSCFAQHISRWLLENGYCWVDNEPRPEALADETARSHGYGIFSARTGNIYTPAMLRQWISMALGQHSVEPDIYFEDGTYYDAMRPSLIPGGYPSREALIADRLQTLSSLRSVIEETDVFVFTLGLTEAWVNSNGFVYASCPGTVRGVFDPERHIFKNYTYLEILSDMEFIIHIISKINPNIRFLLTVSPVPLTATASGKHIIQAVAYSKATLRAVAGNLADQCRNVDYFPSYELVTTNCTKQNFFEDNLRNVRADGVDFVMRHFGLGVESETCDFENNSPKAYTSYEEYCDDLLIEKFNVSAVSSSSVDMVLLGDSHMGLLSQAFDSLGVAHSGGMIMNGSAWTSNLLHLDNEEFFVPLEDSKSRKLWKDVIPTLSDARHRKLILTNLCMQTHRSVQFFVNYLEANRIDEISPQIFRKYFLKENELKIQILKKIQAQGHHIVVVSDPPTRDISNYVKERIKLWEFYDDQALMILKEYGFSSINAGIYFSGEKFSPSFYSDIYYANGERDWFHGSAAYYLALAELISEKFLCSFRKP